jgi:hypothetical protein
MIPRFTRRSSEEAPKNAWFAGEDRGLVTQIDFMTSMVIRIVAFSILLAAATALIHNAVGADYSNTVVAERGASRLADDLLVTTPGDAVLNATCTEAFFEGSSAVCGFDDAWTAVDRPYLNAALAIDAKTHVNVTITGSTGAISTVGTTSLRAGAPVPDGYGTVTTWHRQVGLESSGTGEVEWHTITVSVWG